MDKQEFFLLIPAIIYGVAIVDLLKIFSHRKNYYEMIGWGVAIMMAIVANWTRLYGKLATMSQDKIFFLIFIVQATITAQIASIITPEEKHQDTKAYFLGVRRNFFILLSVSVFLSFLVSEFYYEDQVPVWTRILGMALYIPCIFIDKVWLRNTVLVATLIVVARAFIVG